MVSLTNVTDAFLEFGKVAGMRTGIAIIAGTAFFAQVDSKGDISVGTPVMAQGRDSGCNGPNPPSTCRTGDVTVKQNVDQRVRVEGNTFVAAPGMSLSHGWCQDSISGSLGIAATPLALGLSKSQFSELCGKWYTVSQGATNPNCVVGMYSVAWATTPEGGAFDPGSRRRLTREAIAMQAAMNACEAMPRPRRG